METTGVGGGRARDWDRIGRNEETAGEGGREPTVETATTADRFAVHPILRRVLRGRGLVGPGAEGPHVRALQEALEGVGYRLPLRGPSGSYEEETAAAVARFQRDAGLRPTGRVDGRTLEELATVAPPAGRTLERNPEYERLLADGRLQVTIAHGFIDEEGGRLMEVSIARLEQGLVGQGFFRIEPERLGASDCERLGVGPDAFEPGATYFHRTLEDSATRRPIEVVLKILTPHSSPTPEGVRAAFERALGSDEVVVYLGHARYGTGPDFDPIESGRGNFVVDRDGGPRGHPHEPLTSALRGRPETMLGSVGLPPGGYQLLYFNACTTENYLEHLRDPATFPGRDTGNTDIVATTIPMRIATAPEHVLGFVSMLCERRSVGSFVTEASEREAAHVRRLRDDGRDVGGVDEMRAGGALLESGFADNAANRVR